MHTTFFTTTALALLSLQTILATEHEGMPKQNHARFLRVKRGGPTIHLIGDETVAAWSGGGVPNLPAIQAAPAGPSSSMNLLDSINAGLGAPIGKPTSSSSATSPASSSKTSSASSASQPPANEKLSAVRKIAAVSSQSTDAQAPQTQGAAAPAGETLAVARGKPAKRSLPEEGVVREDASEDALFALGRRAAAANATIAIGRNKVDFSSSLSSSAGSSAAAGATQDAGATARAAAAVPRFSAGEMATPQGWGGRE